MIIDTPAFMRLHYPTVSYAASGEMEPRQRTFLCLTPLYLSCSEAELISQLREHNNGRIEHAAFHEGFPGHQLHLLHSACSSSPAMKRTRVKSSLEGWALFCEDVFEEREHYTCDGLLALHEARLWRAARFLVESGLGSGMMRDEDAYRVLTALPGCTPAMAGHEMAGLLINPGEASLYEIGRAYLKRLGSQFKKLHPQSAPGDFGCLFLKSGAVPPILAGVLCGLEAEDTLERIYDTLCLELARITEIWHRETHEFL